MLAIFVEGHLMTISAKSFSILITGFSKGMFKVSDIGTQGKLAIPPGHHVFEVSNSF